MGTRENLPGPVGVPQLWSEVGEPEPLALMCPAHAGRACSPGADPPHSSWPAPTSPMLHSLGDVQVIRPKDAAGLCCQGAVRWAVATQGRVPCQLLLAPMARQPSGRQDRRLRTEVAQPQRPGPDLPWTSTTNWRHGCRKRTTSSDCSADCERPESGDNDTGNNLIGSCASALTSTCVTTPRVDCRHGSDSGLSLVPAAADGSCRSAGAT